MIQNLLAHGASLDALDHEGRSCLFWVKDLPVAQLMIEKSCSSCSPAHRDHSQNSALGYAVLQNEVGVASYLLEQGWDANSREESNRTPLFDASDSRMVTLLLNAKADVNLADNQQRTPLFSIFVSKHQNLTLDTRSNIVRDLIFGQADVNISDVNGQTPLHVACHFGSPELVEMLVHGCLLTEAAFRRDQDGKKPLDYSKRNGSEATKIRKLIDEAELSLDYSDEDVYRIELITRAGQKISDPTAAMREWQKFLKWCEDNPAEVPSGSKTLVKAAGSGEQARALPETQRDPESDD